MPFPIAPFFGDNLPYLGWKATGHVVTLESRNDMDARLLEIRLEAMLATALGASKTLKPRTSNQ